MKLYKTLDNDIQIVEYDDSLAEAIAQMWNQSSDSWGGDSEITTAKQVISEHSGGSFFNVFVAMKDGEALGYCSFDRYFKDADTAYVHVLNVRPDYHGKKVGKELVLLCVLRTIELGYPRLDIHTWAGNTKAVPLYKKCGFLWEDRSDSTHLQNQIPTVLKTELFSSFFKKADWYEDSSRVIEIKPDGVKINKFEVFGYSWEKDGERLSVGFEKTGRRIRLVETDDYKIEMMADNHELAFGLSYKCTFKVEKKTDKALHVKIAGKNDGIISFDLNLDINISETSTFSADFFVNPISEEQDPERPHPCVLADVWVNGRHAEFGLGIEARFPVVAELVEKRLVPKIGTTEAVYINIKNALPQNGIVKFSLPENALTRFDENSFSVPVNVGEKAVIPTKAIITGYGCEALPVEYEVTLDDGCAVSFIKPLYIVNQGIDSSFSYETALEYGAVCGLWRVSLNKRNNGVVFCKSTPAGNAFFRTPSLGKPYSDEFDLLKPIVRVYEVSNGMVMEAEYASLKFVGVVLTEVYEINASGVVEHRHRVTNNTADERELFLKSTFWTTVGRRSVLHYNGAIHEIRDDLSYGFSNINSEKIDENWLFDSTVDSPCGIYWPPEYKPFTQWGDALLFEYPFGTLKPGETKETKPVVYMCGVFTRFNDFRNYVLGINEETAPYTHNHLEIETNGANPIVSTDALDLVVRNNRLRELEGNITIQSESEAFDSASHINTPLWEEVKFPLTLTKKGIDIAKVSMRFSGFELETRRAIFVTDSCAPIKTEEKDGVFTVINGMLSYRMSPHYSDALFSLRHGENEWLYSNYPSPVPYAWWNPFVGGIQSQLQSMSNSLVLREKREGYVADAEDNFGNKWTGVRSHVSIREFDELKGFEYEQYYMTLPGLPVLCYFVKLINRTGAYQTVNIRTDAFISGKENLCRFFAEFSTKDNEQYRLRMGSDEHWNEYDRLAVFSYEGDNARNERLYIFKDANRDNGASRVYSDVNSLSSSINSSAPTKNGDYYITKPIFYILTDKTLSLDALSELENIRFI